MKNSSRYFKNTACQYYPCHKVNRDDNFNCLFCYCPMNQYEDCLGTPEYIKTASGRLIKDCSDCIYPHQPENYDAIMKYLAKKFI